jgi:hypothetical protein
MLTADYRFAPSRVTASFIRGCQIQTLGGFLKIDVTRSLEAELKPELARVQQRIDRQLPTFEKQAAQIWSELSKQRGLPLGGCVAVQPQALIQGPAKGTRESMSLRFALLAAPEMRTSCVEAQVAEPLPSLVQEPALPAEDDVIVGMVMPLERVALALESSQTLDLGDVNTRVLKATTRSSGDNTQSRITLGGEVCGDVDLDAGLAFSSDGGALRLASAKLSQDSAQRLSAAGLQPNTFEARLAGATRITLPIAVDQIKGLVPLLAKSVSDPNIAVRLHVSAVEPHVAAARGPDFVSWLKLRGRIELKPNLQKLAEKR